MKITLAAGRATLQATPPGFQTASARFVPTATANAALRQVAARATR